MRNAITARNVTYNWHDAETSYVEAVLSRGDRRLGKIIERVWREGGRLEAWSDYFDFKRWLDAFSECGLKGDFFAPRARTVDVLPPWEL